MRILLFILSVIYFTVDNSYAQIIPIPGEKLNYTQVMFEYKQIDRAEEYLIQIALDDSSGNFKEPVVEINDSTIATLVDNLKFGQKYIWRYAAMINGKRKSWNGPYKFEIADKTNSKVDYFRCRVLKNDHEKSGRGVLTLDYAKFIIDREGKPILYLRLANGKMADQGGVRDLRLTDQGTIMFLGNNSAIECDIKGNILWEAPNDGRVSHDTIEYYHHDFRKLNNGNYMILGEKYVWRNIPPGSDLSKYRPENIQTGADGSKVKILFSTIIEYNQHKDIVWSWNSSDYFEDKELFSPSAATNTPRRDLPANAEIFGHMNAFDFDSTGQFIYAGFRDISRIIKIDKQSGRVVHSWGEMTATSGSLEGNNFFKNQHDLNIMPDGNILVFNNNDMKNNLNSSNVVIFSQPNGTKPSSIVWQFDCKFDSLSNGKSTRNGGADFFENNNILICMGGVNRITEVTRANEIVWDGFLESRERDTINWLPVPLYRVHHNSSLYPCYFTIMKNDRTGAGEYEIIINNEGTNADNYLIKVHSDSKDIIKTISTGKIHPGMSEIIKLNPRGRLTEISFVEIISETNSILNKSISYKRN